VLYLFPLKQWIVFSSQRLGGDGYPEGMIAGHRVFADREPIGRHVQDPCAGRDPAYISLGGGIGEILAMDYGRRKPR
jgi:hypothetical protein